MAITQDELKRWVRYDPTTGRFIRVASCGTRNLVGQFAGSITGTGYRLIGVGGSYYNEHRLVWLYVHGQFPALGTEIDHINGDRSDNRIENLRVVTRRVNIANAAIRNDNACGVRGVYFEKQCRKWRARIKFNNKHIDLGFFTSIEDAKRARQQAVAQMFPGLKIREVSLVD